MQGLNGPGWIRTNVGSRQRVYSPSLEKSNSCDDSDLSEAQSTAYKPAYKENPKTGEIDTSKLSPELTEIITVWPKLPEAIRSAILAIVMVSKEK